MNTQGITVERFSGRVLMPGFHGSWSTGALVGAVTGSGRGGLGLSLSGRLLVSSGTVPPGRRLAYDPMIPDQRAGR